MHFIKVFLSTVLSILVNISPTFAEVTVEANQENQSYEISGQIILDDTFSGSDATQIQGVTCEGCAWLVTHVCYVFDQNYVITSCTPYTECQTVQDTLGVRKKVWRKFGDAEPWLLVGMMCVGPGGPNTPQKLTTTLTEQTTEYLPRLIPTTQPANHVLVNTDVFFISNQPNYFGPKSVVVAGIPVTLTASPTWTWKFSDGTVINTTEAGAGFPEGKIRHSFFTKGLQTVTVTAIWNATWQTNSKVSIPVPGKSLTQSTTFTLISHEAQGVLTR